MSTATTIPIKMEEAQDPIDFRTHPRDTIGFKADPHRVYLAGKIAANDWRHTIFNDLRDIQPPAPRQGFLCCGPFFISCDHGCYHGADSHGWGVGSEGCGSGEITWDNRSLHLVLERISRDNILLQCRSWIDECDVVFCYVDGERAFGTIFELGYAAAKGKSIYLAIKTEQQASDEREFDFMSFWKDAWLVRHAANRVIGAPSANAAWEDFVRWYWERHVDSTVSTAKNPPICIRRQKTRSRPARTHTIT